MISNERPTPHGSRPHSGPSSKPATVEDTIKSDKIQIERKVFVFTLKENPRGRFLRITEDVNGAPRYNHYPGDGLGGIQEAIGRND